MRCLESFSRVLPSIGNPNRMVTRSDVKVQLQRPWDACWREHYAFIIIVRSASMASDNLDEAIAAARNITCASFPVPKEAEVSSC